jgi:hypothetical protein
MGSSASRVAPRWVALLLKRGVSPLFDVHVQKPSREAMNERRDHPCRFTQSWEDVTVAIGSSQDRLKGERRTERALPPALAPPRARPTTTCLPMAPKKAAKDKKAADPGEDQSVLQSTAFVKKGYPQACAERSVEPLALQLDRGEEGSAAFLHLAVHPGLSLDPKAPACTPQHVRALMDALLPYGFLVRLAFWSVAVKDEGVTAIAQYLVANRTVTELTLTDVGLTRLGCKALGEALEKNATLQKLQLDHNASIGNAGAAALGESLRASMGLSNLSLTYCSLEGLAGADAIVSGSMRSPTLRALELKGNRFGSDGVLVLLRALKTCGSLFRITLADTGFGMDPEVHAAIEDCFRENKACHEYVLGHNHVGDSCVYRWLGMVRENPHLILVDVTNQCDPMLFKQIGDATASNKKEWQKQQKKGKKGGKGKKKK